MPQASSHQAACLQQWLLRAWQQDPNQFGELFRSCFPMALASISTFGWHIQSGIHTWPVPTHQHPLRTHCRTASQALKMPADSARTCLWGSRLWRRC